MQQSNPFYRVNRTAAGVRRTDMYLSAGIHFGIIILLLIGGLMLGDSEPVPTGGGEFVSVEMVILQEGNTQAEAVEAVEEVVEEEQIEEAVEEPTEEAVEIEEVEIEETVPEEVIEEVLEETSSSDEFIGVGAEGEAGTGAPGPASYEGRVFSAIRRNFRTSVTPPQSYRISFTVNLDGTTSYSTYRNSGDSSFDRAVTHALNSASIPPVPPGRSQPVQMNIEFFGPGQD